MPSYLYLNMTFDLISGSILAFIIWYMFRYYLWSAPYYSMDDFLWIIWNCISNPFSGDNQAYKGLTLSDIGYLGLMIPWFLLESMLPFSVIELKQFFSHQLSVLDVLLISLIAMLGVKVINMLIEWAITYKSDPARERSESKATEKMMELLNPSLLVHELACYLGVFLTCLLGGAIALLLTKIIVYP